MSHDAYRELGEFFPALPERRFEKFTGYWYSENNDWYCNNCEMFFYEGKKTLCVAVIVTEQILKYYEENYEIYIKQEHIRI